MTYNTASNFNGNTPWQTPFVVINRANYVISYAEGDDITDAEENAEAIAQYAAEARVVRAMALFDLTRIYGTPYTKDGGESLGAPIITEPVEDIANNKPSRSTVAECYTQIEQDLNDAINSGALPEDKTQEYVNLWTAKALQVRVYMTKGEWANALSVAQDIITNSPYQLWTTSEYADAWNENNSAHENEIMLEMLILDSTDWTDREGIAYCYADLYASGYAGGYGDIIVTKDFSEELASDPTTCATTYCCSLTATRTRMRLTATTSRRTACSSTSFRSLTPTRQCVMPTCRCCASQKSTSRPPKPHTNWTTRTLPHRCSTP